MAPHNKKYKSSSHQKSMNRVFLVIALIVIVIVAAGIAYAVNGNSAANQAAKTTPTPTLTPTATGSTTPTDNSEYSATSTQVLLHTSAGDITIELRNDKPITTANFINIVKNGWYNGTTFYRTMAGFMIQGGQISHSVSAIKDEIGNDNHNVAYTIAMAKTSSPNSATNEFFINAADNSKIDYGNGVTFDNTYSVFGKVVSGQNIVDTIANAAVTNNPVTSEPSVPVHPVTLISANIIS
jgi:cyclophilin family peptidyl-prolyl cis-trans isomerase